MSAEISEESITDERLNKYLHEIAKRCELSNPKFHVVRGSKVGDNYVGLIYRAVIEGEKNGEPKTISTILKCVSQNETHKEIMNSSLLFNREIFFYKEILPTFDDIAKDFNVTVEHFAKFYGANEETDNEMIILEDLRRKGYVMKSDKSLDYPHASLIVRCIGKLHAYSFVLRQKKPEVFAKLKTMKDALFDQDRNEKRKESGYVTTLCDVVDKALSTEDEIYRKKFDNFRKHFFEASEEVVNGQLAEPYAVVNHGDAWTNNFLFKYEKGSTEPSDMYFLDFQMSRYASPALDLLYLFYCSCLPDLRKQYFDKLLHEYYESLSEHLRQFDCDPETTFPFEILLEHMKRFGKFAAIMTIFVLHVTMKTKVNDLEDLKDAEHLKEILCNDSFHQDIIKKAFMEFVDRGYF